MAEEVRDQAVATGGNYLSRGGIRCKKQEDQPRPQDDARRPQHVCVPDGKKRNLTAPPKT
jgi:hypothetical protein